MFPGFDKKALRFLQELKRHNTKEWFAEHKHQYQNLLREPSKQLIDELDGLFIKHNLPYEASIQQSLFRINRDIRFSKDKSPYKTNIGITFPVLSNRTIAQKVAKTEKPGMYLHIEPGACFIAGGLYMPDGIQLSSIRNRIESNWKIIQKIQQQRLFKQTFPNGLLGEKVKTMPRGYDPEHPGKEYIRMKQFIVMEDIPDGIIVSNQLINELLSKAKAMAPLIIFLNEAIDG